MTANVHSMVPQASDLVHRHVQFTCESRLVGGHVLGKQPPHNLCPYRFGQLALEESLEHGYFAVS